VGLANSVPVSDQAREALGLCEQAVGSVTIRETGESFDGWRVIEVEATFPALWLRGGEYWVSFIGYSGTADPDEQFFWGTSGNRVVKGRPGVFFDGEEQTFTDIDEVCCGCTDFNFCIVGDHCKILLDNGGPRLEGDEVAAPSIDGVSVAARARVADDFVVPPCEDLFLCYAEAWVWTNCDTVRVDLFDSACHCPTEMAPIATFTARCVTPTETTRAFGNQTLTLKKAQFYDFPGGGMAHAGSYPLAAGHNYWFAAYAVGDNRQNARGYFAFNRYCDRSCWINFDPGCEKGPPYATSRWVSTREDEDGPYDYAFLVAVEPTMRTFGGPLQGTSPVCFADVNHDGHVSLQDLFDYLQAYFAGCP
jgi:hypothetical protein